MEQVVPFTRKNRMMLGGLIGLLFAFGGAYQYVSTNADYVCQGVSTNVVDINVPCANGAWGDWATVSENTDTSTGVMTMILRRVYTGTRVVRHIINTATTYRCSDRSGGPGGSDSISVVTQACQISETRTVAVNPNTITGGEVINDATDTTIVNTSGGTTETLDFTSQEELDAYRATLIDLGIQGVPQRVPRNASSNIRWNSVETNWCDVRGENGDAWIHSTSTPLASVAGAEDSLPITGDVIYTLTCEAFNGDIVTDTTTVGLLPVWSEQ